jgi:chorismate mutase
MPRKPKPPPDDPEQSKRFIDMAREVEADEGPSGRKTFERVFNKVIRSRTAPAPTPADRQSRKRPK